MEKEDGLVRGSKEERKSEGVYREAKRTMKGRWRKESEE